MEEILERISSSLDLIALALILIMFMQFLTLLFKDNNGGFYLSRINDTLEDIAKKNVK